MTDGKYPDFFDGCVRSHEDALKLIVKSHSSVASGFATSEPHSFYHALWDHIVKEDVVDFSVAQGLYMGPHKVCVGDALAARGKLKGWDKKLSFFPPLASVAKSINQTTQKLDGLARLIGHYEEMKKRRIRMVSGFMGAATNMVIPDNLITRFKYPDYAGRNTSRSGITDMHSVHFPDAVYSLGFDVDKGAKVDAFVTVMTPPDEKGDMSLGPANGANSDLMDRLLKDDRMKLLLYLNPKYPFTRGHRTARNTFNVKDFKGLADSGRLVVVEDEGKVPSLPAGNFDNPKPSELAIAENLVNHIEMNLEVMKGRAIQVGFGQTGVLAIRRLKDSSWTGREYSEMLEPFTYALFEAGKIEGSHFIEDDGTRTRLDGKLVGTFTICEEGSDFYKKIDQNDDIIVAPSSRVVIPEGFYGGLGINNILGIDFQGHVNSGGRYQNHHSGMGGAAMINRGLAKGGVAYLCLKSTHATVEGKRRSSIFPFMPLGTPVSLVGPDVWGGRDASRMYLVTEHGVARLSGKSQSDYIKSIISVAHPDFRDFLKKKAYKLFRAAI